MLIRTENNVLCDTKNDWGYQSDEEFATCMFAEKNYYRKLSDLLRDIAEKLVSATETSPTDAERQEIQKILKETRPRPVVERSSKGKEVIATIKKPS